jgi:hypothetical protein
MKTAFCGLTLIVDGIDHARPGRRTAGMRQQNPDVAGELPGKRSRTGQKGRFLDHAGCLMTGF